MRYRGPRSNWAPIILTIIVAIVALVALYYLFMAPKAPGVTPTLSPTPSALVIVLS